MRRSFRGLPVVAVLMVLGCGGEDPRDPQRAEPAPRPAGGKADQGPGYWQVLGCGVSQ